MSMLIATSVLLRQVDEVAPILFRSQTLWSVDEEFTNIKSTRSPHDRLQEGRHCHRSQREYYQRWRQHCCCEWQSQEQGLTPLFKIRGYGDAARALEEFTVAPDDVLLRYGGCLWAISSTMRSTRL